MRLLALAIFALLFAGCVQPAATPVSSTEAKDPAVIIDADRPDTTFGDIVTGPSVGPDLNATTALAPRLIAGEWWRIEFSSPFYDQTSQVVRVVADVSADGYIFGMPHEGWYKEAISYHAPAFGDVGLDLSYATHNEIFAPLKFPLVKGATWETTFATQALVATVEDATDHKATITFAPPAGAAQPTDPLYAALGLTNNGGMRITYDAQQHEVVEFTSDIGTWRVVEHGYGFEGWVTVPRGEHTAIDYGQFLPATPGEPVVMRTQDVSGGFNRLTMMHAVFALGPGAYHIKSVTPNGTEFVTEVIGGAGFSVKFYEASDPDGLWQLEDIVGGPGGTYSMGIAYHQYDIRLPDGARRSDHSHSVIR